MPPDIDNGGVVFDNNGSEVVTFPRDNRRLDSVLQFHIDLKFAHQPKVHPFFSFFCTRENLVDVFFYVVVFRNTAKIFLNKNF